MRYIYVHVKASSIRRPLTLHFFQMKGLHYWAAKRCWRFETQRCKLLFFMRFGRLVWEKDFWGNQHEWGYLPIDKTVKASKTIYKIWKIQTEANWNFTNAEIIVYYEWMGWRLKHTVQFVFRFPFSLKQCTLSLYFFLFRRMAITHKTLYWNDNNKRAQIALPELSKNAIPCVILIYAFPVKKLC